jgi:GH35 family endo-1,4-beta-xylanase
VLGKGEIDFQPAPQPFRISLPLTVPGFGQVFLYADHRGKGHTRQSLSQSAPLLLNYEFAADRLTTVHKLYKECRQAGLSISAEAQHRAAEAERLLKKGEEFSADQRAMAQWSMESLRESLWAGEMVVFERARQLIKRHGPRLGFLFGCNAFEYQQFGKPYAERFEALFNYATLPFYHGGIEKVRGQRDYSGVDYPLAWLRNTEIICKGHPLIFLIGTVIPDWLRNRPFEGTKQACLQYVRDSIRKYRGRIHVWDVINEAHVQPEVGTGVNGFTREQNVELTFEALRTAREADPTCYRVVNSTGTWGDYYLGRKPAVWQQSAYDYLQMMKEAQCEYEAVGLQYYHSGRDLLEFERDIARFKDFGKPIHLTELGIPSSSEDIPGAEWWGGGVGGTRMAWHGEHFTETIQADWIEQLYTIAFSKPYIVALTWWDFSDPAFVPHGGLLRKDMTPKEGYQRLLTLLTQWRQMA